MEESRTIVEKPAIKWRKEKERDKTMVGRRKYGRENILNSTPPTRAIS